MNSTNTQQIADLGSLRGANEYNRTILDDFASRTNNQSVTKVDQIIARLSNAEIPRWAVIRLFRGLEKLGHGHFVEGRKGHPSRFLWSSSSVEVGRAAKGENVSITEVAAEKREKNDAADMMTHRFYLRPNLAVTIDLPADFSEKEAERMGNFLKTVPV